MSESSANARPPYLALAVAAAACLVYLGSELAGLAGRLGFPLDDSWIHLQFARQLAAGAGLAYNPGGAWISGSTSPLWTALLAPGFLWPAAAVAWSKLLGCAFFLATVDATGRLAAALGLGAAPRQLAAVLVAATHWLVWSALSGLEVGLFAWLSLWGILLHLRERAAPGRTPASLAVFAAAALARPEGHLLLVLALADRWRELGRKLAAGDRGWLAGLAGAAVVLVPTLLFYRVAGGSFLPTTFAVKAGAPVDLVPDGRYLRTVVDILFGAQPAMLLLAGAGALGLAARRRSWLPAAWPIGLALAYSLLTPAGGPPAVGNFGRYYFPVLPVVVVLGVLGLEDGLRTLAGRRDLGALCLRGVLAALVLAPPLWGLYRGPGRYLQTVANVEQSDVAAARWLAARLPPEAVLAVQDIGALKYFLPNPVIDLAGIVTPEVVPILETDGPVYWEQRLLSYLAARKPDFLVVFPSSYPALTSRVPGIEKVRGFPVTHNVTMAGDELAIFTTPWTRFDLGDC